MPHHLAQAADAGAVDLGEEAVAVAPQKRGAAEAVPGTQVLTEENPSCYSEPQIVGVVDVDGGGERGED